MILLQRRLLLGHLLCHVLRGQASVVVDAIAVGIHPTEELTKESGGQEGLRKMKAAARKVKELEKEVADLSQQLAELNEKAQNLEEVSKQKPHQCNYSEPASHYTVSVWIV